MPLNFTAHFWTATVIALLTAAAVLFAPPTFAHAQVDGSRVEFTLTIDAVDDHSDDAQLRSLRQREIAQEVVNRIETRLDSVGISSHNVRTVDEHRIRVTVYGKQDSQTIKSMVVPAGKLQVRPVLAGGNQWLEVAADFPEGVELRAGSDWFRTDNLILFSHSAADLRDAIDLVDDPEHPIRIFPHEDGWRAIELGPVAATERDVDSSSLERTPSGIPFVSITFTSAAAQQVRAAAAGASSNQVAIVLDDEIIALHRISDRRFSQTIDISPPEYLRSTRGRLHWGHQVAGRLATPIPIQLVELEE